MFKILAMTLMVLDHVGLFFFPDLIILRIIGRLSFPFFAFGIAYGYSKSKNVVKYGQRILLLALISQPIFFLLFNNENLNICFTLLLGLIAIYVYDKEKKTWLKFSLLALLLLLSYFLKVEYGIYGVLMILFFYILKNNLWMLVIQSALTFIFVLINMGNIIQIFAIPAFFFINYFENFNFKINKVIQYVFYPAHLLIIYLILLFMR